LSKFGAFFRAPLNAKLKRVRTLFGEGETSMTRGDTNADGTATTLAAAAATASANPHNDQFQRQSEEERRHLVEASIVLL
jgi:hypothetical protein